MIQLLVLRILRCSFWKYQRQKISPPEGITSTLLPLIYWKYIYDLTITILNKLFEFLNDSLKIIPIKNNCTQFCFIPLCWRNQKFRTTSVLLKLYASKSNHHQTASKCNLIESFINFHILDLEIEGPQNFGDIHTDRLINRQTDIF